MTIAGFTPRSMRILAHVHNGCTLRGWDQTIAEVAEAISERTQTVRALVTCRGWADRFRLPPMPLSGRYPLIDTVDDALEVLTA
ncbi:hypothetical protein GI374_11580 [Paracoccus sp. S-4012]|uniref:hypothetical protein n=1 Tax=Paracoccus sp. S-4012 TaxID=2665648 RepID=UPI0012AF7F16|nr:hypothetical protein [Paracoccus sp. S-4012]MRX51077.1 hypothetical protein [Paracoccus sp. S-4012]